VKGDLECAEDFLIEGSVEGDLRSSGTIVLGKDAVVRGEVSAREVVVSGTVIGSVKCSVKLEIYKSAAIVGTIQAPVLKMESDARVNGRIVMSQSLEELEVATPSQRESNSVDGRAHH
jgi:cytoskeletal protein CcmA (bactofilin family)